MPALPASVFPDCGPHYFCGESRSKSPFGELKRFGNFNRLIEYRKPRVDFLRTRKSESGKELPAVAPSQPDRLDVSRTDQSAGSIID